VVVVAPGYRGTIRFIGGAVGFCPSAGVGTGDLLHASTHSSWLT